MNRTWFCRSGILLSICSALAPTAQSRGQAVKVPPNPQAPLINMPMPMGIQAGTRLELQLTGTRLNHPLAVWTDIPHAKVAIPMDNKNGTDPSKLRLSFEVPKDTPVGIYSFRLATRRGLSNVRLFCVDDLPQVLETGGNNTPGKAQTITYPCVVIGRVDQESDDYFKIAVKAGQRIAFDVLGRRLGGLIDPQITLLDDKGRQLPRAHNNDAPGCQTDCRLVYTFSHDGFAMIRIRDVEYRGGADYVYRLRIGDFPLATTPVPLVAKRGSKLKVEFTGLHLADAEPVVVTAATNPGVPAMLLSPKSKNGFFGWPVTLRLSDITQIVEQEPNDQLKTANRIPVPVGITGRFLKQRDQDHYTFSAKKGESFLIQATTYAYQADTEVLFGVKDKEGKVLARIDPAKTTSLGFVAPSDGDYTIFVEHLLYWYGPNEAYHLGIRKAEPDFELNLVTDRYDLPQRGHSVVFVEAARRNFNGPIELKVIGPSGLRGSATIPAGQNRALLPLECTLPPGAYAFQVAGSARINGKERIRMATADSAYRQALNNLSFPPPTCTAYQGLAVVEQAPFTLAGKCAPVETYRGKAVSLMLAVQRSPGFTDPIAVTPFVLPPNVKVPALTIPKGKNEIKTTLTPANNAPLGSHQLCFVGRTKFQNQDYLVYSPPFELEIVEPVVVTALPAVKLVQGSKANVKVAIKRQAGYNGPVVIEVRNLPANVQATKVTIQKGKTEAEIEIVAAANASVGTKNDVRVFASASEAKQSALSPPFTVIVDKKP
ncbi:MAG: hypothetical protein KatS3mg105_2564 [Gemmatales bacterium]|nr:MAG: hypothetical protein KatS3mg105_2564 [Gemmatales bacterium]